MYLFISLVNSLIEFSFIFKVIIDDRTNFIVSLSHKIFTRKF